MSHKKSSTNWTLQDGYKLDSSDTYPRRVNGPGESSGLFLMLKLDTRNIDYLCRGQVQGFKVILHTPNELPITTSNYFRVPLGQEVLVSVMPNVMTTSSGLKKYAPDRRVCYFDKERYLRFFKTYSKNNCELECLGNFTLSKCGCVKFSLPRDENTKVCLQRDIECYLDAEKELSAENFETSSNFIEGKRIAVPNCNCLPSCTSISYEADISQADYEFETREAVYEIPQDTYKNMKMSQLRMFFNDGEFIAVRRSELYGLTDFVANCGGLMGELNNNYFALLKPVN